MGKQKAWYCSVLVANSVQSPLTLGQPWDTPAHFDSYSLYITSAEKTVVTFDITKYHGALSSSDPSSDTTILVRPADVVFETPSFDSPPLRSMRCTETASMIFVHLRSCSLRVDSAYWEVMPPQGLLSNMWPLAAVFSPLLLILDSSRVSARSNCVHV